MTTIYVVPHTEATHHIERRVGGWYDSELTDKGRSQAQAAANALKDLVAHGSPVYASDLARAMQTAEPIAAALGSEVVATPDLREISCGTAEGKPQTWLEERIAYPPKDASRIDHEIVEGAESRRSAATRIKGFVDRLIDSAPAEAVVVTHGFATTFVLTAWIGMPVEATAFVDFDISPGSITTLQIDPRWGNRSVLRLNDTRHLPEP